MPKGGENDAAPRVRRAANTIPMRRTGMSLIRQKWLERLQIAPAAEAGLTNEIETIAR
jgi:hypothetical protein